jgi:hypothetical protein
MEAVTTIADLTARIFLYIVVQVNGREDSEMSDSNENGHAGLTRRAFMMSTALAAGALTLPPMALANEDEFAATSGEPVYFRGWQYKPDVVQDNVDKYNKLHSGKVDYQTVTGDYPALMEKSLISGDKLDMIYANPPTAVRFYEAGWIKPADDLLSGPAAIADMYDKVRDAWTYKGKVLGLSYFLSPRGIVCVNRQRQEELGIKDEELPKTWDEFYAHLDALGAKGVKDAFLPHWFNEFYGISWAFLWEVINRGGTTVDPKTHAPTVTVDNAAGKTLAAWKKLWKTGKVPEEVLSSRRLRVRSISLFVPGRLQSGLVQQQGKIQDRGQGRLHPLSRASLGPARQRLVSDDNAQAITGARCRRQQVRQLLWIQKHQRQGLGRARLDGKFDAVLRLQDGDGEQGYPGVAEGIPRTRRRCQGIARPLCSDRCAERRLEGGLGRGTELLAAQAPG